jgi:small acid-soluble spore protein L (minor)
MSKKNKNRGQMASSVNPQGHGKDTEFSTEVASKLENKAKKSNTKR